MKRSAHIGLLIALALGWCNTVLAQGKKLPDVTTTEGREFFVTWLPNSGGDLQSQDLQLLLLASSRKANTIVVEYANGLTSTYLVAAGQTVLIDDIDQQLVYWDPGSGEEEMMLQKGIRVYSQNDEKFTLYSINQNGVTGTYSFDGAHILPVEALGTEYLVQTATADEMATEFVVMSTKPGETHVTMDLKVNSRKGNTQHLEVTLTGAKQIYIVRSKAPNPEDANDLIDLSGSSICADQTIAVWSGNQLASVPNQDAMSKDHAYDQLLPLNKWGKNFLIPLTGLHTQYNEIHVTGLIDNTTVTVTDEIGSTNYPLSAKDDSVFVIAAPLGGNQDANTQYITADKPVQVYMYTSAGAANPYDDPQRKRHLQGDPSMTLIPPLEYLTDTTIFSTYDGGDGGLVHEMRLWARTTDATNIQLDGNSIAFSSVAFAPGYSEAKISLAHGTHIITAPTKCFSGYVYGMNDGQTYIYPVGYDFTPKEDSLFLKGEAGDYPVHESEWKNKAISDTESGWHLDKTLLDNGTYLLDSIFVCDSTTLDFPIKTYEAWYKVRWEIEGSIQGMGYYTPTELLAENVARPELEHQFTLLPSEQNREPYEDFEVRGILIRKPILCDIPEDKWERDTFNTIVRVLRQYNDTTWRAICWGDTVKFFRDTVKNGTSYTWTNTIFSDEPGAPECIGQCQYQLGANTFTRHYISSGGCDSLSTLALYVCPRWFTHIDTVVCQEDLRYLQYGEFFQEYSQDNSWPKANVVLRDTLWTKGCIQSPDFEPFSKHCPSFHGCDSVLELNLKVKLLTTNGYTINQCKSLLPANHIVEWREKISDRLIKEFWVDTMEYDKIYTFREYVKYVECTDCPSKGCDSVRNVLQLQFVSDEGQFHTVHVCQGKEVTYRSKTNAQASITFRAIGDSSKVGSYVIDLPVSVKGKDAEGRFVDMCSFIDQVTFIVDTVYDKQMTYATVCWDPNDNHQTYEWIKHPDFAAIPVTKPGLFTYVDTMKTVACGDGCNCDSICILELRVGQPYLTDTIDTICDDGAFTWQDTLFYGANYKGTKPAKSKQLPVGLYTSRRDTVSQYKCDSVLTLSLTVWPTYVAERKDTFVCANQEYVFYDTVCNTAAKPWIPGQTYELKRNVPSIHGCDSAVLHYVTVYPVYLDVREANDTVCQQPGATYDWEDHPDWTGSLSLDNADTYEIVDYMHTANNCDSIVKKTVVILPSYDLKYDTLISSEDTIHWEGRIYAGDKAEFDHPEGKEVIVVSGVNEIVDSLLTKPVGTRVCDSIRTLTLTIGQIFRDTAYDATCANCGTYNWVITSPITGKDTTIYITDLPEKYDTRVYYDSLKTELNYDSIYVLYLTAYPSYKYTDNGEICQGQTFDWIGHYSIPTTSHGTMTLVDSIKTDTIYTNPKTGEVKRMRCDSVWILTLTVHPTYNDRYEELTDRHPMASNDTISHFVHPHILFVGYDFDSVAAGVTHADLEQRYDSVVYLSREEGNFHRDSVRGTSKFGCDSVHYVNISICEVKFTQLVDSIGDNDTTWHFGGNAPEHSLPLVTGYTFHLDSIDYTIPTGRTMREYLFIDTLITADGCDSIVHDSVYVFPTYRFQFDTAVCSNKAYYWEGHGTTKYNERGTGVYYDSVNYTVGTHIFDSVYVLNLQVMPSGYWEYDTMLCMNDTIMWHFQQVYYRPGGLQFVEAAYQTESSPCGEVHHMNLNFKPFYGAKLIEYDTICQLDPYGWVSPGETKEHTEALYDGDGNKIDFIPTDVPGDFLYYDSLKTVGCGCDSVYTLHLHIYPTHRFVTETTICTGDDFEWIVKDQHGNDSIVHYQSDVTTHIFDTIAGATTNGCDSSYYLHVFVDQPYKIYIDTALCAADEHFTWNGKSYDDLIAASSTWIKPQEFFDTIREKTVRGQCDSTLYLHLTIAPSGDSIWTDSMCIGETYMLFERAITQAGYYEMRHENYWGCETNYKLTLENIPATIFHLSVEPVCYDEEGVASNYILRYTYEGEFAPVSYSLRYDSIAHSIGFEDEEDVPLYGAKTLSLPVPSVAAKSYPRPGYYDAVISFKNGVCQTDSLMRYPFKMEMRYPSWITEQRHNDVIALLNEKYNGGGYTWSAYQWYENDQLMEGQTKPYLHVPTGLTPDAAYSVALTRTDDNVTVRTCPLIATYKIDAIVPTMGYLSVTPTCVVTGHPYVNILSRHDGNYRVTTDNGQHVSDGIFRADVTEIRLPESEGLYIVQLWSDATPEEPYRAIKVLVSKQCPNCDTSSF